MKIISLETWNVSVPYLHDEISSRVARGGVTDTIVRLTADNGLMGWGECTSGPDVVSIEQVVRSAIPFVIDRDPWQTEAIARDFFRTGLCRKVISKANCWAMGAVQSGVPKGEPRLTLRRSAPSSASRSGCPDFHRFSVPDTFDFSFDFYSSRHQAG